MFLHIFSNNANFACHCQYSMIQFEKSSLEKIFSKRKRRKTNESKKNFNRARFVLLRTMFTYGCTACFVSAQNRNRRLPTAVLSTHTMFPSFVVKDLTDRILPFKKHWEQQNIFFDALYTGYMASSDQIDKVLKLKSLLKEDGITIVDPAMADNGKLYIGFDQSIIKGMKKLCKNADVILPNITEACFLTGTEFKENYDKEYILSLMEKLSKICPVCVVTGVKFDQKQLGVAYFDGKETKFCFEKLQPKFYHGTGDIFASVFAGTYIKDKNLAKSCKNACKFVAQSIKDTLDDQDHFYGVHFENNLCKLK